MLTEPELAQLLGKTTKTLWRWRKDGSGPKFTKTGRGIFYRQSDVQAWFEANTHASTAEYALKR